MLDYLVPMLLLLLCAVALRKQENAYELLLEGGKEGLKLLLSLVPTLIRPISGSAALAVGADLMAAYGPDSEIGRTAAIMLGSTETTFYTISVYFGAAGVRKTRYTIPAALTADLVGFCMASLTARLFFAG